MLAPSGDHPIAALTASDIRTNSETSRARRRWLWNRIAIYGALTLFAAIYLLPAAAVVLNVFRGPMDVARDGLIGLPTTLSFEPWIRAWTRTCVSGTCNGVRANFVNSLMITVPATLVATALGTINGYVLSKWRFPGHTLIFAGILLGVFLPLQVTLLPWAYVMGKLGLANDVRGLILIHSVQGIAFTTLFCRNFYAGVPDAIVNAARIDGAGFWRIFFRVVLPLSTPILAVSAIWQFTMVWNDYLFGMVFTSGAQQPITAALMSARAGSQSATVIIAALPPMLVFLVGGRYFVRGLTEGALR